MGESGSIAAVEDPVTPADVSAALRAAGVRAGDVLIVHSSLSSLGWVVGGPRAVVDSLLGVVGDGGTIVMPAQTGMSDPSTWVNPPVPEHWWPIIRDTWPAFDPELTPLRAMGAVVECFRHLPDVLHSGHPAVGFVARGPLAADIVAGQPLEHSLGDTSPLGALYRHDACIVMIGVGHGNNTSLHLAEHRADYPGKQTRTDAAPLVVDGRRRWVTYEDLDRDDGDFVALGAAFAASGGPQQSMPLGIGRVTTCRMRDIVDFAVEWLVANRRG